MDSKQVVKRALAGVLALGVGVIASEANADAPKWAKKGQTLEKCAGVVKTGKNDCGAKGHECAGKATTDNDPEEWVYVPEGVCDHLTGGTVKAKKKI